MLAKANAMTITKFSQDSLMQTMSTSLLYCAHMFTNHAIIPHKGGPLILDIFHYLI